MQNYISTRFGVMRSGGRRSCAVATDVLSSRDTNTSLYVVPRRGIRPPGMAEVSNMQEQFSTDRQGWRKCRICRTT